MLTINYTTMMNDELQTTRRTKHGHHGCGELEL